MLVLFALQSSEQDDGYPGGCRNFIQCIGNLLKERMYGTREIKRNVVGYHEIRLRLYGLVLVHVEDGLGLIVHVHGFS